MYSTYYTTRKDNAWAKANPDEVQQCYIMTGFHTAQDGALSIPFMKGISPELMQQPRDDIRRWWEVVDRSTGAPLPPEKSGAMTRKADVILDAPEAYHEYTVSFLAYLIWDPVHMYNAVVNGWKNFEHQITFDVRQPKTHAFLPWSACAASTEHPMWMFCASQRSSTSSRWSLTSCCREKYVDWYGYSASVSPYILGQFEKRSDTDSGPSISSIRAITTTSTACQAKNTKGFSGVPAPRGKLARDGGHHPRILGKGHDVPRRSLDRHGAVHAGVRRHRP